MRVSAVGRRKSCGGSGAPVKSEGSSTAGEVCTLPAASIEISETGLSSVSTCVMLP